MMPDDSIQYGFKRISPANWKEMDEIIQFPSPVTDEIWVRACLKPQLESSVPENIAALFEVVRGSMVYGWFFYPLITLATEQCHRVVEAGARLRCEQLGLATKRVGKDGKSLDMKFADIVQSLVNAGAISRSDQPRWNSVRKLRNRSSHPARQTILSPGMALSIVEIAATFLNRLFK